MALTHLGQLVKNDLPAALCGGPVLRHQVRTQLNRGEARTSVRTEPLLCETKVCFAQETTYQIMNRASCLEFVVNAVLVHNTLRIARVLEQAPGPRAKLSPQKRLRICPPCCTAM